MIVRKLIRYWLPTKVRICAELSDESIVETPRKNIYFMFNMIYD